MSARNRTWAQPSFTCSLREPSRVAECLLDVLALEIGVTRENLVEGGAERPAGPAQHVLVLLVLGIGAPHVSGVRSAAVATNRSRRRRPQRRARGAPRSRSTVPPGAR